MCNLYAGLGTHLLRPAESDLPGAGVAGSGESLMLVLGIKLGLSGRAVQAPNH